jgi:hypothetical protein
LSCPCLQTLSIIASENVFNLQFINEEARDMFTERLFLFVLFFLVHRSPADAEGEEDEQQEDEPQVDHERGALQDNDVAVDMI